MSCGPHQMNIGWLVFSRIRKAVRRLCGQVSGLPSGLADQLYARVSAPISPPPARKSAEVGLLIFNIQDDRCRVLFNIGSRNLTACHNLSKPSARAFGSDLFFQGRNKMAGARAASLTGPYATAPEASAAFVEAGAFYFM